MLIEIDMEMEICIHKIYVAIDCVTKKQSVSGGKLRCYF